MKTFSVAFKLTLDIVCPDHLDPDWVADQFVYGSDRFSTFRIAGDPAYGITIQAASSGTESIRRYASQKAPATPEAAPAAPPDRTPEPDAPKPPSKWGPRIRRFFSEVDRDLCS